MAQFPSHSPTSSQDDPELKSNTSLTHKTTDSGEVQPYSAEHQDKEFPDENRILVTEGPDSDKSQQHRDKIIQRRGSQSSHASRASIFSRFSRNSNMSDKSDQPSRYFMPYGDVDEATVALERAASRATVASRAGQSSSYRPETRISTDGLDEIPAGMEFEKDDPELVSWESEFDPENPRNWTKSRKFKITALAGLQTLIPTVASSILAPAVPNILATYDNSNSTVGSLMVSIMVLVWGFSAIIWAPLAEIFGRKLILIVSAAGNSVFNICCAVSPTTATMSVFRALGGLFNSAPIAMSAGALADIYEDSERQWPLALWASAPACGPGLAPVIAGWIAQCTTWKWVFWVVVIMQGATLVALVLFFDETYPQLILHAKKMRSIKETGNQSLHTVWDLTAIPFQEEMKLAIVRPILFSTLNPVVSLLAIYSAYTYGFMYLILTDFPDLWKEEYNFSPGISGLMYLGYALGMLIGVFVWPLLINWWYDRQEKHGKGKSEDRLFWLPISTVLSAAGMFWYGWSAQAHLKWPMPVVGIGIFSFALFCVFQCVQSYIVSLNPRLAGSAISSCVLGRCILGGTFPLFGRAMYHKLGYGWASTVVALLAVVLGIPWPIGIYIYGPRLRAWADANIHID